MAWYAAIIALTSFSFYQDTDKPKGIGFFWDLQKPNLSENNSNDTKNNMMS